jgi:hypothetical protein
MEVPPWRHGRPDGRSYDQFGASVMTTRANRANAARGRGGALNACNLMAAATLLVCGVAPAAAGEGPGDCLGVDFDRQHSIAIGKITAAKPRVNFVKSVSDNAGCPADSDACQEKAYLIPGDLALVGKTFSGKANTYSCAVYESAAAKKVRWTKGWLPAASMTPVTPAPAPARADWTGDWVHASGHITIANGANDAVTIQGEAFYDAAQNVHTGVIDATAKPARGLLQFADDGSTAFDKASGDTCLVRMQRIEALLVVEDNSGCGGVMVTFMGFYRKK